MPLNGRIVKRMCRWFRLALAGVVGYVAILRIAAVWKQGYSGSEIGVHGPHVAFSWLGHATVWPDWTLGCVAVGTWAEIRAIADWVAHTKASEIVLV